MKIIFVRHGHPDYGNDCLTELGHKHAEAVSKRLSNEKIDRIYSSSCGRAVETAEHIARQHGMEVKQFDFMREISWHTEDEKTPHNGHPWRNVYDMIASDEKLVKEDWNETTVFLNSIFASEVKRVGDSFDELLQGLGYKREGNFYRVLRVNNENIVMASHAGSSSAVFSRIFNLPAPFVFGVMLSNYTGITIVSFEGESSELISPRLELFNDARHISDDLIENVFGN